ncbi:MAG: deoxyribonuclease V [Gammaproteobacteria bacterium]
MPELRTHHPWHVSPALARVIQDELAADVECTDRFGPVRHVGGVDIGFEAGGRITRAAVVILSFPELALVEHVIVREPTRFPYVPGLLSFREIPALLQALDRVRILPDVILCDAQGRAHPRRFGVACHLGVLTDLPTLGVAKQRLIGRFETPAPQRGAWSPLLDRNDTVGVALRTRDDTQPVFVSVGHRVSLPSAIDLVLACTPQYRLPETTRQAHRFASTAAGAH